MPATHMKVALAPQRLRMSGTRKMSAKTTLRRAQNSTKARLSPKRPTQEAANGATIPANGMSASKMPMRALSNPRSFRKKMKAEPKMVKEVNEVLNRVATIYHHRRPNFLADVTLCSIMQVCCPGKAHCIATRRVIQIVGPL